MVGEEKEAFLVKVKTRFKTLRGSLKRIISVSGGLGAVTNGIRVRHRAVCQ